MTITRTTVFFVVAIAAFGFLVAGSDCPAQRRGQAPHLAYAYPAGCERGMPSEIVVGGQYLQERQRSLYVGRRRQDQDPGWYRPLSAGEYNNLRMRLTETP